MFKEWFQAFGIHPGHFVYTRAMNVPESRFTIVLHPRSESTFSCLRFMTMLSAYKRIAWHQLLPFNSKHVTLKFQKTLKILEQDHCVLRPWSVFWCCSSVALIISLVKMPIHFFKIWYIDKFQFMMTHISPWSITHTQCDPRWALQFLVI